MIELKKYGFRFYLENNPEKSWFVNINRLSPNILFLWKRKIEKWKVY